MARRLTAWNLQNLETAPVEELHATASNMARELLEAAQALFHRVLQAVQTPSRRVSDSAETIELCDGPEIFLEQVDRTVEAFSSSASADIAFIAKLEMQSLERELEGISSGWDRWKVIELCERIRRHIVKATTALRRTMGQELDIALPGDEIYVTELARSIQVRRRLALFRQRVQSAQSVHQGELSLRLRLVGTNIAMLICSAEYRDIRVGDRMVIRDIQRTILDFLQQVDQPELNAQRIWHDVVGALEITRQVNCRPELLEHDHLLLEALEAQLGQWGQGDNEAELLEQAQAVFGRDDRLDALITAGQPLEPERWRIAVKGAMSTVLQHKAPESATEEIREASSRSGVWALRAII